MATFTKNLIPSAIIIAGLIIAGALIYVLPKSSGEKAGEFLPLETAVQKAVDYINENLLSGDTKAVLLESSEVSGAYKFKIKIGEQEFESYITKDVKLLFPEVIVLEEKIQARETDQPKISTIGDFLVTEDEICKENEKPIVYFFGANTCPHCRWEHPIIEKVAKNFEENISFHNNMDLDEDMEIFRKYSTGGIPTLVLACKYYRVGSGEQAGEEAESKVLTALICKLTGNQPVNVCQEVQDLINQIHEPR